MWCGHTYTIEAVMSSKSHHTGQSWVGGVLGESNKGLCSTLGLLLFEVAVCTCPHPFLHLGTETPPLFHQSLSTWVKSTSLLAPGMGTWLSADQSEHFYLPRSEDSFLIIMWLRPTNQSILFSWTQWLVSDLTNQSMLSFWLQWLLPRLTHDLPLANMNSPSPWFQILLQ